MPTDVEVKDERIEINQNETDQVTEADGTADVLSDIFDYKVPDRSEIIIEPTDYCALYIEDASAEIDNKQRCVVEMRDARNRGTKVLLDGQYESFKEFQDSLLKKFFGQRWRIPANWHLVVAVNDDGAIDASDSRFAISCTLVYETLS